MSACKYLQLIIFFILQSSFCFANKTKDLTSKESLSENLIIEDFNRVLQRIPFANSRPKWENAFTCNQAKTFFIKTGMCHLKCEFGACEDTCSPFNKIEEGQIQAEECTSESLKLYSSYKHTWDMTRLDYENSSQTIALSLIKQLNLFYEPIEKIQIIQSFYPIAKKVIEAGQLKQINIARIILAVFPNKDIDNKVIFELEIAPDQTGLNQIVCLGSEGTCVNSNDYLIKRKGVINAIL